jgi:hypothetical protein
MGASAVQYRYLLLTAGILLAGCGRSDKSPQTTTDQQTSPGTAGTPAQPAGVPATDAWKSN